MFKKSLTIIAAVFMFFSLIPTISFAAGEITLDDVNFYMGDSPVYTAQEGQITAVVDVTNINTQKNAYLITAAFDGDLMTDMGASAVTLEVGKNTLPGQAVALSGTTSILKVFLWGNGMSPLVPVTLLNDISCEKTISDFQITLDTFTYKGDVNLNTRTVTVEVPLYRHTSKGPQEHEGYTISTSAYSNGITNVVPAFSVNEGAVSDYTGTPMDMTHENTITVTAENGTTAEYKIRVINPLIIRAEDFDTVEIIGPTHARWSNNPTTISGETYYPRRYMVNGSDTGSGVWYHRGFWVEDDGTVNTEKSLGTMCVTTVEGSNNTGVFNISKTVGLTGFELYSTESSLPSAIDKYAMSISVRCDSITDNGIRWLLNQNRWQVGFKAVSSNTYRLYFREDSTQSWRVFPNSPTFSYGEWYDIRVVQYENQNESNYDSTLEIYVDGKYISERSFTYSTDTNLSDTQIKFMSFNPALYNYYIDNVYITSVFRG